MQEVRGFDSHRLHVTSHVTGCTGACSLEERGLLCIAYRAGGP